ncbi:unnamed protein product, partial [Urochloa humidicola]
GPLRPRHHRLLSRRTPLPGRIRPLEAVCKGNAAVRVRGVEKKSTPKLQDSRSVRKIASLDTHIALACAGRRRSVASPAPRAPT